MTKSSKMWDQGLEGTDSDWGSPAGGRLEVFATAQAEQAKTKHCMSRAIDGHQNLCLIRNIGRLTPGEAVRTIDSISHVTAETKKFCSTMGSEKDGHSEWSKIRDNIGLNVFGAWQIRNKKIKTTKK